MKLSGPTCSRKLNKDEKDVARERKVDRAGWVRLERRVRHPTKLEPTRWRHVDRGQNERRECRPRKNAPSARRPQRQRPNRIAPKVEQVGKERTCRQDATRSRWIHQRDCRRTTMETNAQSCHSRKAGAEPMMRFMNGKERKLELKPH